MKPATILSLAALYVKTCTADFWIYDAGGFADIVPVTYFCFYHNAVNSCSDVGKGNDNYLPYDNVSKRKGIACDGNGCEGGDPNQITRFEMNTDWGHYSECIPVLKMNCFFADMKTRSHLQGSWSRHV